MEDISTLGTEKRTMVLSIGNAGIDLAPLLDVLVGSTLTRRSLSNERPLTVISQVIGRYYVLLKSLKLKTTRQL